MGNKKFAARKNRDQVELGTDFAPEFNEQGLIPCITTDVVTGEVLMFAWMNEKALALTLETGKATYYSRSRRALWVKGESSGRSQHVKQLLVDCDQDVIQISVEVRGEGTCHRGYRSCFYRAVSQKDPKKLEYIDDVPAFDPDEVYGSS